jgi:DNA modification methylase
MKMQNLLNNPIRAWELGTNLLINGDSLKVETYVPLKSLGKKVTFVLCDVPYGISYTESKLSLGRKPKISKEIINDGYQTYEEYKTFSASWLNAVKPYLANKNSLCIFNSDRMVFSLHDALVENKFKFSQLLVWVKNQSIIGRLDYNPQHELIAYAWFGTHLFNGSKDKSVLFYPRPKKSPFHPTTKPVGLLRQLILNHSNIDDLVLDCFIGSGSTLWACMDTHRKCVGIEIDTEYCQSIIDRYEKRTGLKAKEVTSWK